MGNLQIGSIKLNDWFCRELGDGVDAYEPSARIQKAFMAAFIAAGQPVEMAVFSRYDLRSNVVTVYFPPAAAVLASVVHATPCAKPALAEHPGLGLLVGNARCWEALFPGESVMLR